MSPSQDTNDPTPSSSTIPQNGRQIPKKPVTRRSRGPRNKLRRSTIVDPRTGQRVRRSFTLTPNLDSSQEDANEHSSLLGSRDFLRHLNEGESAYDDIKTAFRELWHMLSSHNGQQVLKCSLAYVLGSLATFVPFFANLIGRTDGKHVVATVVVYFHPARTAGSMLEAIGLASLAFIYSAVIAFASMGVSVLFGSKDLLVIGHVLVLVIFCGGSLGAIAWLKQKLSNPLVNVACSLASLAIITVLTKESAIQDGRFSVETVSQVLKMVLIGVFFSALVSLLIIPISARRRVKDDLIQITDLQETILTAIARSFFSGSEDDFNDDAYKTSQTEYQNKFNLLVKHLRESKYEHYVLGTEQVHHLEARLVKCIESIQQSLTGLRSAATTQFSLIDKARSTADPKFDLDAPSVTESEQEIRLTRSFSGSVGIMEPIDELIEPSLLMEGSQTNGFAFDAADVFSLFIRELGPPMKALVFTLKTVLHELPFSSAPDYQILINERFKASVNDAKDLFVDARQAALNIVYKHKTFRRRSPDLDADYEEVAASCGHFSSSLEDLAEDIVRYLEVVQEMSDLTDEHQQRSWKWIKGSQRVWRSQETTPSQEEAMSQPASTSILPDDHSISPRLFIEDREHKIIKYRNNQAWSYRLWRSTSWLRRDHTKFAIKVGLGAVLYAMFSFIDSTRPIYTHWRGEWGLVSYMLVCSSNMGASNATGSQRFLGTCLGAVCAITAWFLSRENSVALGFLGWVMSLGCFYIIVVQGKAPMGRFIFLTYNLSALYAYTLSIKDDDGNDDDEGGGSPEIWEITFHRLISVAAGCVWGLIVTRMIWPISARKKVKDGVATLWLRMGMIWKRDPMEILTDGPSRSTYMDIKESIQLQRFLNNLDGLRESANHEYDLRGPFSDQTYQRILDSTGRILGAFYAMHVVISKNLKASKGEAELLKLTKEQRTQLSARVSHLFCVLASSMKLEYPMNDSLPNIEHARDRFLAKLFAYRQATDNIQIFSDEDYELFYVYGLVTGQIQDEIQVLSRCIEQLYGVFDEDSMFLQ